jgi:hypothetical protein
VYLRVGAVCGLPVKETLLLPVGVLYDLLEMHMQTNGYKRNNVLDD